MEEQTPNPKEYVKIKGIWQHTSMAWYVDKEKMNAPIPTDKPGSIREIKPGQYFNHSQFSVENYQCVAHVHHWKTELQEYCRVDEDWKCTRCGDETPQSIQSMIKLYRPLKDVNL